ncbi:hypothetical protein IK110_01525 [Candidatus Saccharibacteria bacterium]|nr:hypothetical protein [Candidatus Saccharibacteria bacterium]
MKKIIKIGAVVAFAAAVFLMPQESTSAASGVRFTGRSSIPVKHTITNVSGPVSLQYKFAFKAKDDNPGEVTGINSPVTAAANTQALANKTAVVDCSFNLTGLTFPKVGDYAFEIYELSTNDPVNFPLDTKRYEAYFHVYNEVDENNSPTGGLRVVMDDYLYDVEAGGKVGMAANFSSEAGYSYISLSNTVTGMAAETDKYFKYKVDFDGIVDGTKISVAGQDANVAGGRLAIVDEYTVGDGDLFVYLKHGQEITIGRYENGDVSANELPQGASYTITKVDTGDGYTTEIDGAAVTSTEKTVAAMDNRTVVTNNKEAVVGTGVYVNVLPFAAVAVLSLSGLVVARKFTKSA